MLDSYYEMLDWLMGVFVKRNQDFCVIILWHGKHQSTYGLPEKKTKEKKIGAIDKFRMFYTIQNPDMVASSRTAFIQEAVRRRWYCCYRGASVAPIIDAMLIEETIYMHVQPGEWVICFYGLEIFFRGTSA